ncbi:MAG TPA: hypothetical protein VFQ85_17565 [Mycobacteriales bacterium]|nr:hypothetical protein [Mycobacteriales bacterium]
MAFDLAAEAHRFAGELSALLNATVCTGIRLSSWAERGRAVVQYGAGREPLGIPLTLGRRKPRVFLGLSYRLAPDHEDRYLMVTSSFVGLFGDAARTTSLLHYDYERGKADGYPEAHVQVVAEPELWGLVGPRDRPFARAHLPVGGRRYRPTLEDLVEFAVVEGLAEGRDGWAAAVAAGRAAFRERQLRAAIRRDPATARDFLAS